MEANIFFEVKSTFITKIGVPYVSALNIVAKLFEKNSDFEIIVFFLFIYWIRVERFWKQMKLVILMFLIKLQEWSVKSKSKMFNINTVFVFMVNFNTNISSYWDRSLFLKFDV